MLGSREARRKQLVEGKGSAFVRVPQCLVCWLHTVPVTCRWCHSSQLLSALCRVVEASTLQQERLQAIAVSVLTSPGHHLQHTGQTPAGRRVQVQVLSHRPGVSRSLMRTQNGPCQCVPVGAPPGVSEPAWLGCTLETGTEQATGSWEV